LLDPRYRSVGGRSGAGPGGSDGLNRFGRSRRPVRQGERLFRPVEFRQVRLVRKLRTVGLRVVWSIEFRRWQLRVVGELGTIQLRLIGPIEFQRWGKLGLVRPIELRRRQLRFVG
jgi:hypothetical protein